MITTLASIFDRDLQKLADEIRLYSNEEQLWKLPPGINNSGGNLSLHLIGNLNHFIGMALGKTGYVRQRDLEFSNRNVPRQVVLDQIEATRKVVSETMASLTLADLQRDFPLEKHGSVVSTEHMLLHLFSHLSYHLGQINYHRRVVCSV